MGALIAGITNLLQPLAQGLIGPFGILLVTIGIAGTAMAVLWFHVPMSWLWKAVLVSMILLLAGVIAGGLHA